MGLVTPVTGCNSTFLGPTSPYTITFLLFYLLLMLQVLQVLQRR
jgi:hypothetical protein